MDTVIEPGIYSLLPPLIAIVLAIKTRLVVLSLAAGIWLGYVLLAEGNIFLGATGAVDGTIEVFANPGNTRVLIFTLLVGGLLATIEATGGVKGFTHWLQRRRWVNTAPKAQLFSWMIGLVIFVESNTTLLVAGTVSRPIFDRLKIAREKLAYLIDSTSAPICILIPFNAWGAFNLGLLNNAGVENTLEVFLLAIPLNLYAITCVLLAGVATQVSWEPAPMRRASERTRKQRSTQAHSTSKPSEDSLIPSNHLIPGAELTPNASFMILPICTMVLSLPLGLLLTGNGDITQGSGSTSVLWAVLMALITLWLLSLAKRRANLHQLNEALFKGAGNMLPIAAVLLLSMALGDLSKSLQTGQYIASLVSERLSPAVLLPLIFLVSGAISFSIGSSWSTFAIMIPIAIPVAEALGLPYPPLLAAVLSGAIFGDHASPVSDTTIVASMAAATDHIDHVKTQLPYALFAGGLSALGFGFMGIWL